MSPLLSDVRFKSILTLLLSLILGALCPSARSLPAFSRKYGLPCETCHSMPPRLTRFGYDFYRAGYRLPGGDAKSLTLANALSFLTQVQLQNTNPGGDSGFNVSGVEAHLATSVGKQFAVRGIYAFASSGESGTGFQESWVQFNATERGGFFLRAGQLPVLDGYQLLGGRNITLTDPLLFGANGPLSGDGQGNFAIASLERGVELGYSHKGLHGRVSWLNGVDEGGNGNVTLTGHRANDFVLQADYLIGKQGSGISGFYYVGKTPFVTAGFHDNFTRSGLFGTWAWTWQNAKDGVPNYRLEANAGWIQGRDVTDASGQRANSQGSLVEAALYLHHRTAVVARYDSAHVSGSDSPTSEAWTYAVAHRPNDYLRAEIEYRLQRQPGMNSVIAQIWFFY